MSQKRENIRNGLIWTAVFAIVLSAVLIMRTYAVPKQPQIPVSQQVETVENNGR